MKKTIDRILSLFKEIVTILVIVTIYYAISFLFMKGSNADLENYLFNKQHLINLALIKNFLNINGILNLIFFGASFFLYRLFVRNIPSKFSEVNSLATVRDYLSVFAVCFIPQTLVGYYMKGTYIVPVIPFLTALIIGIYPLISIKSLGYEETFKVTLQEMFIVAIFIFLVKFFPVFFVSEASYSIMEYLLDLGMTYIFAHGVYSIIYYPKDESSEVHNPFQAFRNWILSYLAAFLVALTPFIIGFTLAFFLAMVSMLISLILYPFLGEFIFDKIFGIIEYKNTGLMLLYPDTTLEANITLFFAPAYYMASYLKLMVVETFKGDYFSLKDFAVFILSIHYLLRKFKPKS